MSAHRRRRAEPSLWERPSLVVGVVLAVLGGVLLFVPALAAAIPGNRYVVIGVGLVALVAGASLAIRRRRADYDAAETGEPEAVASMPRPGDRLQRQLARVDSLGRAPVRTRKRVRERVRAAAVAVVRRHERVSEETASAMVAAGEWTDDVHARRFVGDPDAQRPLTVREHLAATLSFRSRFGFGAHRTIRAVLALSAADGPSPAGGGAVEELDPGPAVGAVDGVRDRRTGRWTGVGALALVAGAAGMALTRPALVLLSVVGVTYAAHARSASPPAVDLSVERELSETDPRPGETVTVTVSVTNEGDALLADLRLVDGVPPGLAVVEGSPRLGTALRPGRTATFAYGVEARRGVHEFGPLGVFARDGSGERERETSVPAPGTVTCIPQLSETGAVPLVGAATRFTGRVATATGGEGVEFFATREYRPGDPPGRIDWNRHARTRELATLMFREERAATVVLLLDGRAAAYRSPAADATHALDRGVEAAGRVFDSLLSAGDRVGIASFGPRSAWLAPGAGGDHRERARRLLATDPAFAHTPPEEQFLPSVRLRQLRRRLPVDAQFILFSPVTDDYIATVARRLVAHGYPVTVVSPDVTAGGSPAHELVRVERRTRLNALRESSVRVVDWAADEELAVAIERASAGWSA